jgi:NAD(P)-dependent dehydrogenase (short-subunit alcohol dehydrogenase family)
MTSPVSLDGKVAVVTGAASGLGRGIAEVLAANGATIVIMDRADASETVSALSGDGGQHHHGVRVDVSDPNAVATAFDNVDALGLDPDLLVNCAGIREIETALDLDPQMWQRVIGVNLSGPFYCAQQVARRMAARGSGGAIVNVTSVAGLVGMTHRPAYTSSKHGLIGLTKNLARDLSPHQIRVNAIAPGTVRTPLTEAYYHDDEFLRGVEGMVPLGFEGSPTDVANAVLFFASDLSSWVTGTVLPVDGGWLAERNYAPPGSTAYTSKSSGSEQ